MDNSDPDLFTARGAIEIGFEKILNTAGVNMLFLLPSVGYGFYLLVSTGSPVLLVLSGLTLLVWLVVGGQRKLDISQPVRVESGRVWLGDRRLNLFPWTWSTRVRDTVYPALFPIHTAEPDQAAVPTWALGVTRENQLIPSPLSAQAPHALLIGQTGSGKTELIKRIIGAFQGEVVVIDFKGGFDYESLTTPIRLFVSNQSVTAIEVLRQRLSVTASPMLVVVDELAEALRNPQLSQQLESISAKGRSLGVHFVGASQTMTGIPRTIWSNCHSRFALRADPIDRAQLGFPIKPLELESPGYAELFDGTLKGFRFPAFISETLPKQQGNPLLFRVETTPLSEPGGESAPSRQTPWGQQ